MTHSARLVLVAATQMVVSIPRAWARSGSARSFGYLPMWPRYIAHPPYVKGFKHIDGLGLGTRLMYVWIDR
jgi:hypothetical protein